MRKVFSLVGIIFLLIFPMNALANTSVQISNNGSSSTSTVNVQSNQSSSNGGTTDITIESNGVTKTYHGTGDQNVYMESADGHSQVTVNNQSSNGVGTSQNNSINVNSSKYSSLNPSNTPKVVGTSSAKMQIKQVSNPQSFNVMTFLKEELATITNLVTSLFH